MSYQPPPGAAPPPAPADYQYGPQVKPKKSAEQLISNGLILAVVLLAGILLLVGAILTHSTRFLEVPDDIELMTDLNTISLILMDVAMFMLVVFLTLAAILRNDMHHWVRAAMLLFAALGLIIIFTAVYSGSLISGLIPYYP